VPDIFKRYCPDDDRTAVTGLFKKAQAVIKPCPCFDGMADDPFQYDFARDARQL
jgi:hypothetical protein